MKNYKPSNKEQKTTQLKSRRLHRISYIDRITNEDVLQKPTKETVLNTEIKDRKLQFATERIPDVTSNHERKNIRKPQCRSKSNTMASYLEKVVQIFVTSSSHSSSLKIVLMIVCHRKRRHLKQKIISDETFLVFHLF